SPASGSDSRPGRLTPRPWPGSMERRLDDPGRLAPGSLRRPWPGVSEEGHTPGSLRRPCPGVSEEAMPRGDDALLAACRAGGPPQPAPHSPPYGHGRAPTLRPRLPITRGADAPLARARRAARPDLRRLERLPRAQDRLDRQRLDSHRGALDHDLPGAGPRHD